MILSTQTKKFNCDFLDIKTIASGDKPWSTRIINCLNHIQSKYVLYFLEDEFLQQPVNIEWWEKMLDFMEENADAFIVTPGGIGTFDEFFQVLTLKQLRQHNKPIALFNINGYYYSIQALMHNGAQERFLREDCLELYRCFDENEIDDMIEYIENPPEEEEKTVAQLKYS